MEKQIRILKKVVGEAFPTIVYISDTLDACQEIVGGYIECVRLDNKLVLVCNEEGKLTGLKPNFNLFSDVIVGDCFFVGVDNLGEFASITSTQITEIFDKIDFNKSDNEINTNYTIISGDNILDEILKRHFNNDD